MTLETELLKASAYLKTQHPRPVHNGLFIDQLMVAAAGELGNRALKMVEMLNLTPPQNLFAPHPDHTSPMTVGPEAFLEDPLSEACDRLYDMLLGDDGEAYFQAERFLKQHRPDLYAKIGMQRTERPMLRDEGGHEIEWASSGMVSEPRGKATNIGE